jgi:two-component system nitrate/nitrite response regulator NarL
VAHGRDGAIRVVIGDRHPLFREGLARAIAAGDGLELAGEADDPWTALGDAARLQADVAVVDPSAPGRSEEELIDLISRAAGAARVVLLTARVDTALTHRAVAGGAAAVVAKSIDGAQLRRVVAAVARGQTVLAPEAQRRIAAELRAKRHDRLPKLAEREQEVLAGLAAGLSAPEIARELRLGTATIKTYLARLYAKLGVSDRAAAVAVAMREGLLD